MGRGSASGCQAAASIAFLPNRSAPLPWLEQRFHVGKPNLVILATATGGGSVDDPDAVAAGQALTQQLAATPGITDGQLVLGTRPVRIAA